MALGLACLLLGEAESLRSRSWSERQQSRAAARAAIGVAAAWFTAPAGLPPMPDAGEWILDRRRGDGDLDGDGRADMVCDGSSADGRWSGWPAGAADPAGAIADPRRLLDAARVACGSEAAPDLLLEAETSMFLSRLSGSLGDPRPGRSVVVERLAVFAAPPIGGRRSPGLGLSVTVAVRRGSLLVARCTATGCVRPLPSLATEDVVAAGGSVTIERGAHVGWGRIHAQGDVNLPATDEAGFPMSGLPRQHDGHPTNFAPGGPVDWNPWTRQRECVLTELLGLTRRGSWVLTEGATPPSLPDPWTSVAAGGRVLVGGEIYAQAGSQQPDPFDPRSTDIARDLSHVTGGWAARGATRDATLESIEALAQALSRAGHGVRRFTLMPSQAGGGAAAGSGPAGEPLWREGGAGAARTAAQWLGGPDGDPGIHVFTCGAAAPPASVVLRGGRGIVLVEARQIRLVAADSRGIDDSQGRGVLMPGEPFQDTGIDADGDGRIDPGTAGNGRWDRDIDDDGVADEGEPLAWLFASQLLPRWRMPCDDEDPALLTSMPHEPFLNLDYPPDSMDLSVRVDVAAGRDPAGRPVRDLDGDGVIRPGLDRVTTVAQDPQGARIEMPVTFEGVVACLSGDLVVEAGAIVVGALRATGNVDVADGARVLFDDGLRLGGAPSGFDLAAGVLTDEQCVPGRPAREAVQASREAPAPAGPAPPERDDADAADSGPGGMPAPGSGVPDRAAPPGDRPEGTMRRGR